jgi:ABC-type polysaccharide/polyol phosphate transport system ATPase subunit
MSSEFAVSFDNITKSYTGNTGLLRFSDFLHRIRNGQIGKKLVQSDTFFALKNITLNIQKGEKVGIIGRNGAGKSTILKIINRIVSPTSGTINTNGNIVALLELGTGFHPDLSGRENIIINGAILGFNRSELEQITESIISISELGHFIDIPVKKYSSGMKIRLGFALAMATSPDIVLLDEILAVGDSQFKKKSIKMMNQFLEGKTLIYVSHNLPHIRQTCNRTIVINEGEILFDGKTREGIHLYKKFINSNQSDKNKTFFISKKLQRGRAEVPKVQIKSVDFIEQNKKKEVLHGDQVKTLITYKTLKATNALNIAIAVKKYILSNLTDNMGIFNIKVPKKDISKGTNSLTLSFNTANLLPGTYQLEIRPEFNDSKDRTAIEIFSTTFKIYSEEELNYSGLVNLDFKVEKS